MDAKGTLKEPVDEQAVDSQIAALRRLLLGDELRQLDELRRRLDDPSLRSEETSKILAEAIALCVQRDRRVQRALQPIVEEALRISVERDPHQLASALFPIVGQAVRKSVAHSIEQILDSLNSILADGFSLKRWRWRIEAIRSGKSFAEIALARSLTYRVEQLYLIHRKTGLLLAQSSKHPGLMGDADLVVGMLTALQDFVRDSFTEKKHDELEILHIGEFAVWLLHGPLAILAVVVRGQLPKELEVRFSEKVDKIHEEFRAQLVSFEANGKPIAGIGEGLDDFLLGSTVSDSRSYLKIKIVAGAVFVAILAALFFRTRDEMRWRNYQDALRQQPGIVIIETHHSWSTFSLTGLRDPTTLEPQSLLAEFHLSPKRVSEHWEGFLSLDPRLADARKLDAEVAALRKDVIHFELNTTKIPSEELPLIDTVSDQIRQLTIDATSQGKELSVKVSGHTDRSGTESRNTELSRDRADTIVRLLVARGVEPKTLSALGLGDTSPERIDTDPYEQILDRRVTFTVFLKNRE